MNTHNISSPTTHNMNSNRRELPNVPRNTTNIDNKPSPNVNQNPFYNPSTTNNTSASRSTPAQWMGNIQQTLRRQTSNAADVRKVKFLFFISFFLLNRVERREIKMNQKIHLRI
jgi:hypothetical protein